jgi:tryptophan synthase alpha chain
MSKIDETFARLRNTGKKGWIPYVTAGDPSLNHTLEILNVLRDVGADLIEVGIPFSDPLADGPVIQRASQRALAAGASLLKILKIVETFQHSSSVPTVSGNSAMEALQGRNAPPIILFSYLNPIWQLGIENFAEKAKKACAAGVLVTDLIPEEADAIRRVFDAHHLDLIFLVAPTSTEERIKKICAVARGFIYAVSRTGTTGTRESLSRGVGDLVNRIRKHTSLPIAVGFGISSRRHVAEVWEHADAAVVGSALVQVIEKEIMANLPRLPSEKAIASAVREFAESLIPSRS